MRLKEAMAPIRWRDVADIVGESVLGDFVGVSSGSCASSSSAASLPSNRSNTRIEYTHLFENEHASMGIFHLPSGSRIPLHNHPGMTVVSRVLEGKLHVSSFDWEKSTNEDDEGQGEGRVALPHFEGIVTNESPPQVLLPESQGNLHEFVARTDCVVLDVIYPPYSADRGRDCTYYTVERGLRDGSGRVVLKTGRPGGDFQVVTVADYSEELS
jgi:hypothetical protein